jgi:hypothetical protein
MYAYTTTRPYFLRPVNEKKQNKNKRKKRWVCTRLREGGREVCSLPSFDGGQTRRVGK